MLKPNSVQEVVDFLQLQREQALKENSRYWNGAAMAYQVSISTIESLIFELQQGKVLHKQVFVTIADGKIIHVSPLWQIEAINSLPEYINAKEYAAIALISEYGNEHISIQLSRVIKGANFVDQTVDVYAEVLPLIKSSQNLMIQNCLSYWQSNSQNSSPEKNILGKYLSLNKNL